MTNEGEHRGHNTISTSKLSVYGIEEILNKLKEVEELIPNIQNSKFMSEYDKTLMYIEQKKNDDLNYIKNLSTIIEKKYNKILNELSKAKNSYYNFFEDFKEEKEEILKKIKTLSINSDKEKILERIRQFKSNSEILASSPKFFFSPFPYFEPVSVPLPYYMLENSSENVSVFKTFSQVRINFLTFEIKIVKTNFTGIDYMGLFLTLVDGYDSDEGLEVELEVKLKKFYSPYAPLVQVSKEVIRKNVEVKCFEKIYPIYNLEKGGYVDPESVFLHFDLVFTFPSADYLKKVIINSKEDENEGSKAQEIQPQENKIPENSNKAQENQFQANQIQENQIQKNQIQENQIQKNQIQKNQIQKNQIQENQIQGNKTQENKIQENKIQENPIQEYPIQENPIQEKDAPDPVHDKNDFFLFSDKKQNDHFFEQSTSNSFMFFEKEKSDRKKRPLMGINEQRANKINVQSRGRERPPMNPVKPKVLQVEEKESEKSKKVDPPLGPPIDKRVSRKDQGAPAPNRAAPRGNSLIPRKRGCSIEELVKETQERRSKNK